MSLAHVKAKFKPAALKEFLLSPSARFAWTPMPDFRLHNEEAENLAAYLLAADATPLPSAAGGDAQRGEKLFISAGCANCHEPKILVVRDWLNDPPIGRKLKEWDTLSKKQWRRGCLSDTAADRGDAPDFGLSPEQQADILAFIAAHSSPGNRFTPDEFAERQITAMRCTACHARDGHESLLATDLDAENQELRNKFPNPQIGNGEGIAPDQRAPILTWAGEKLRPQWMAKFIAGQIPYKPRYYLRARCPASASAPK